MKSCGLLCVNPLHTNFFIGNKTYIYILCHSPHWHDTGSWNPFSSKTRTYLFYIVNIMVADVLATQGARASVTMVLTMLNQINAVLQHPCVSVYTWCPQGICTRHHHPHQPFSTYTMQPQYCQTPARFNNHPNIFTTALLTCNSVGQYDCPGS